MTTANIKYCQRLHQCNLIKHLRVLTVGLVEFLSLKKAGGGGSQAVQTTFVQVQGLAETV